MTRAARPGGGPLYGTKNVAAVDAVVDVAAAAAVVVVWGTSCAS